MKNSNAYLDLIISACKKISDYISGQDESGFFNHSIVQSAVIMQLQVIGEIAKKIDEKTRSEVDVSWKMIIGLRNIIAHDYFALDVKSIWHIASVNIPDLESKLHGYLAEHDTKYLPPFDDDTPLLG